MTYTKHKTEKIVVDDESLISTPSLVIDMPQVRRNLEDLASYAKAHQLNVRPHFKTHKLLSMAQLQLENGAVGLTAAKVGEATQVAGICDDVLLAYPVCDAMRAEKIAALAGCVTLRVSVDSIFACETLAAASQLAGTTVGILVDIDTGFGRTGVQTPAEALAIAQYVAQTAGLRFDGLFTYPGHILGCDDATAEQFALVNKQLDETICLLRENGLEPNIVSGGSTPTMKQSHRIPALTEIRPGTYIYYDWNCAAADWGVGVDACAARIVATVVSDAVPGKVVIDAGSKTLTSDRHVLGHAAHGYGHLVEYPDARIVRLSEEHGEVNLPETGPRPQLGERVHVIPNHICPCVNLQNHVWLKGDDGAYERVSVDARGLLF